MNGKKPDKSEQKWINAILENGCCVCKNELSLFTPAEIHHLNGGSNHLDTLPLCFYHHRQGGRTTEYVSRHPYKDEFENRYGLESDLLDNLRLEIGDYE